MTGKDLLDSLRFVDDDLIEEAGLEQLKEDKQKKTKGKDHGKKRSNRWRADDGCVYRKRI